MSEIGQDHIELFSPRAFKSVGLITTTRIDGRPQSLRTTRKRLKQYLHASSRSSLMLMAIAMLGWLAAVAPVAAQTNEILLQERLISLPVYELLKRRGATTPEQRSQVIAEACRSGVLGPEDCVQRRR